MSNLGGSFHAGTTMRRTPNRIRSAVPANDVVQASLRIRFESTQAAARIPGTRSSIWMTTK